jgi:hypothetical protein
MYVECKQVDKKGMLVHGTPSPVDQQTLAVATGSPKMTAAQQPVAKAQATHSVARHTAHGMAANMQAAKPSSAGGQALERRRG